MSIATLTNGKGRAQPAEESRYRWIALSTVTLGTLMVFINQSIVLISLPGPSADGGHPLGNSGSPGAARGPGQGRIISGDS